MSLVFRCLYHWISCSWQKPYKRRQLVIEAPANSYEVPQYSVANARIQQCISMFNGRKRKYCLLVPSWYISYGWNVIGKGWSVKYWEHDDDYCLFLTFFDETIRCFQFCWWWWRWWFLSLPPCIALLNQERQILVSWGCLFRSCVDVDKGDSLTLQHQPSNGTKFIRHSLIPTSSQSVSTIDVSTQWSNRSAEGWCCSNRVITMTRRLRKIFFLFLIEQVYSLTRTLCPTHGVPGQAPSV